MTPHESSRQSAAPFLYERTSSSSGSQIPLESEKNPLSGSTADDEIIGIAPEHYEGDRVVATMSEAPVSMENSSLRDMKTWRWILLSASVLFSTLLLALDNTVVADLQPQIVDTFVEISKFPWINVNFSLGAAGSALLW